MLVPGVLLLLCVVKEKLRYSNFGLQFSWEFGGLVQLHIAYCIYCALYADIAVWIDNSTQTARSFRMFYFTTQAT
jgi:hypothetical protein